MLDALGDTYITKVKKKKSTSNSVSIQIRDPVRSYTLLQRLCEWYSGVFCNRYSLNTRSSCARGWLPTLAQRKHWLSIKPQGISKSMPSAQLLSLHRTRTCKAGMRMQLTSNKPGQVSFSMQLWQSPQEVYCRFNLLFHAVRSWRAGTEQRSFRPAVLPATAARNNRFRR